MPNLFLLTLRVHQQIYERTGGALGHRLLGLPTLLLHTRGRRTGQPRTSALVYAKDGDDLLVVASNGGHRKPPAWLLNLEAEPQVVAQVGVRKRDVIATPLRPGQPDYERLFKLCDKVNRGTYTKYQEKTDRPIPVVVLSPR
jgi:deazaflavin-dependent oxidoreductase (nitroreductase family)